MSASRKCLVLRHVPGEGPGRLAPLLEEAGAPDVVVVDPPRAGLSKKIVRRLIECEAQKIVSIDPNPRLPVS